MSAPLAARAIEPLLYQVLTGAITRTIATEVTGQDLDLEQSYRFGFARLGPVLVVGGPAGGIEPLGDLEGVAQQGYGGVESALTQRSMVPRRGARRCRPLAVTSLQDPALDPSYAAQAQGQHRDKESGQ